MVTRLAVFQELRRGSVSVELGEESSHPLAPFVSKQRNQFAAARVGFLSPTKKEKHTHDFLN